MMAKRVLRTHCIVCRKLRILRWILEKPTPEELDECRNRFVCSDCETREK
jgi:hypothetical protein